MKATGSGENPYRPSANVAFAGDVTGTVNGIPRQMSTWENISGSGKPEDNATYGQLSARLYKEFLTKPLWNNYISTVLIDKANIGSCLPNTITGNKTVDRRV